MNQSKRSVHIRAENPINTFSVFVKGTHLKQKVIIKTFGPRVFRTTPTSAQEKLRPGAGQSQINRSLFSNKMFI